MIRGYSKILDVEVTLRQREIIDLVLEGMTLVDVSKKLGVRKDTIGRHMTKIYLKFKVKGKNKLMAYLLANDYNPSSVSNPGTEGKCLNRQETT